MPLEPRTLDVMSSYTTEEQLYLYEKTKELKNAYIWWDEASLRLFKIPNPNIGIYEVFLEDSTRTKESFRNAIEFHDVRGKVFDTSTSSFNKHESYADTFNMLTGYDNTLFIVRSKLEWVCTWLDENARQYALRHDTSQAYFINAWDWRHEHPTQEFLDQFSFLEHNNRNRDIMHIALIGDLLHGRTIHSKVEWLRIYKNVKVDLIAPELISIPEYYVKKMQEYGYEVRLFHSLADYLTQLDLATIRYFTRLQIERLGEDLLQLETKLRLAITIQQDQLDIIKTDNIKFFHPLPRHKQYPEIPHFLDSTSLNGRETQSMNGMFIRIVLLAAVAGVPYIRDWFTSPSVVQERNNLIDRIVEQPLVMKKEHKHYTQWVMPISDGIVIDHILKWSDVRSIKKRMQMAVSILGLYGVGGERIGQSSSGEMKWMIFAPNRVLDHEKIRLLAALCPGCTVNIIQDQQVKQKLKLSLPDNLVDVYHTGCINEMCISHHNHNEHVPPRFIRASNWFECFYCKNHSEYDKIWTI